MNRQWSILVVAVALSVSICYAASANPPDGDREIVFRPQNVVILGKASIKAHGHIRNPGDYINLSALLPYTLLVNPDGFVYSDAVDGTDDPGDQNLMYIRQKDTLAYCWYVDPPSALNLFVRIAFGDGRWEITDHSDVMIVTHNICPGSS